MMHCQNIVALLTQFTSYLANLEKLHLAENLSLSRKIDERHYSILIGRQVGCITYPMKWVFNKYSPWTLHQLMSILKLLGLILIQTSQAALPVAERFDFTVRLQPPQVT